jgi:tetratricopeptide (TPR) repeat protein
MSGEGPYLQRIEIRGGTWFARAAQSLVHEPQSAESLVGRGNMVRQQRKYHEALASYEQAIALAPDSAEALLSRGNVLQELRRYREALASYDRVISLRPDYADAFYNRGIALMYLNRLEEALASYDGAIAHSPSYLRAYINRGNVFQVMRRFEEALASYDQAIAIQPNYIDALYNRSMVLHELRRFEEAVASFDRLIVLLPNSAEAFNHRGIALGELDRLDDALASFDRAVALKPSYAEAFRNRANALRMLNRFGEALASIDRAIAIKPDSAEAVTDRANALQELRRYEEALAGYERLIEALELLQRNGAVVVALGMVRLEDDRPLASYDKAIALKPDYAEAFNNRGHLLKDEGRQAEALISFKRALATKPDYADAEFGLCMGQLAILYEDEPEIAACRAAYREALEALRRTSIGEECRANGRTRRPRPSLSSSPIRGTTIASSRAFTARSCAGSWPSAIRRLLSPLRHGPTSAYDLALSAGSSGDIPSGKFRFGVGSARSTAAGFKSSVITPGSRKMPQPKRQPASATASCKGRCRSTVGARSS